MTSRISTSVPSGTSAPVAERTFSLQDVVALDAERLVGLRPHLVDAAERVEVVDIGRAEIDRQRLEDVGDRHVQHARLVAVDLAGRTAGWTPRRW